MSGTSWLSPFTLIDSSLLEFSLKVNQDFEGEAKGMSITINTGFDPVESLEGHFVCRGVIDALYFTADSENSMQHAYDISCSLGVSVGISKSALPEDMALGEAKELLETNALSLAYGKIRSIVENLTSESIIGKITLPAINAHAYMRALTN